MKTPVNLLLRLERPIEMQFRGRNYISSDLYVLEIEGSDDRWVIYGLLILTDKGDKIHFECKIRTQLIFPTEDVFVILNSKFWRGFEVKAEPCNSSMFQQTKELL